MDPLLRFDGAVRCDGKVEAWFTSAGDPLRLLVRPWFERMRDCGRDVRELVHDGCPVACVRDAAFAYVNAFRSHASVGFFRGAELADPKGMLEGSGRYMRHVKLRPGETYDAAALDELIGRAYKDIRRRVKMA
jgi:hypothetical protein